MSDQIFISYSHEDSYFVNTLKGEIEERSSFKCWIDVGLRGGKAWPQQIDEEIRKSFAVIVVVSPKSYSSLFVTYEWAFAIGRKIPILPVLHEESEQHPKLALLQYVDCSVISKEPWDDVITQLNSLQKEYLTEDNARFIIQYMELAQEQKSNHNYNNAIETFREVLRFASPALKDDVHYETAICYNALEDFENAEMELDFALDYNPHHTQALVRKAELLRKKADKVSQTDPSLKDTYLTDASSNFQKALRFDERALDENGESIWASLGGVYKRMNRHVEAIDAYKKAVAIRLTSYPLNNLGLLYLEKQNVGEMQRYFRQVEKFAQNKVIANPNDSWAYNDLLVAQIILGKLIDAEATLDLLHLISDSVPSEYLNTDALAALEQTLYKIQHLDELEEDIRDFAKHAIDLLKR